MEDRCILHSDMNCFYASVEMMMNPALKNVPMVVCGAAENRQGIILTKNEPAKKYGIKTGMVNWEAQKLCPELVLVHPHYDLYLKYSELARALYAEYTDLVEPFGMDECWLDLSKNVRSFDEGIAIAEQIRERVKEELGLTVSIGVSYNKIFAKLGSDMKKPDAVTVIRPSDMQSRIWPLPASELLYVGRATTRRLEKYGILTIGDLANTQPDYLRHIFGVNGEKIWRFANGTDTSRVMNIREVNPIGSIGHGVTCTSDLVNDTEVFRVLLSLSQDLGHRLMLHGLTAGGVQLSVRKNDLQFLQFQTRLPYLTRSPSELTHFAMALFQKHYEWDGPVRALTIRATHLQAADQPQQLHLDQDDRKYKRSEKLLGAVEEIRRRFGDDAITMACLLEEDKIPRDHRDLVDMPGPMGR